jgi:hypothetical protein
MPDRYPDEYVPWGGTPRPVERPQDLSEWLSETNPDKGRQGRRVNCGECARAVARTVQAVDGQSGRVGPWPPIVEDSGFDESIMRYSDAIFFTPEGKVVGDDH